VAKRQKNPTDSMADAADKQGWDQDSQLTLALRFIEEKKMGNDFHEFLLDQIGTEENSRVERGYGYGG